MCNSKSTHQIELTWKLHIPTFHTGSFQNNVNMSSRIWLSMFSIRILYRQKKITFWWPRWRLLNPEKRQLIITSKPRNHTNYWFLSVALLWHNEKLNFKFERIELSLKTHEKSPPPSNPSVAAAWNQMKWNLSCQVILLLLQKSARHTLETGNGPSFFRAR